MADVFLSYSREDQERARDVASGLEAEGLSVWWDTILKPGETYDEVTERNLRDARTVVVLWTRRSVQSKWVRAEATLGSRKSALMPVMLEECDRPLMFELIQTADLSHWHGDRQDPAWREFIESVRFRVSEAHDVAPSAGAAADDDVTLETTFWNSVKDTNDKAEFEAYLRRFPGGHFSDLAKRRLAALKKGPPKPAKVKPARAAPAPAPATAKKKGGGGGLFLVFVLLLLVGGGGALYAFGYLGPIGEMISAGGDKIAAVEAPKLPSAPSVPVRAAGGGSKVVRDCEQCPPLVAIPGGEFMMGSPSDEAGRYGYEGPQHKVTVEPFLIAETEVTFDQWEACVEDGGCGRYAPGDRGWGRGSRPAVFLSWRDGQAYARWLTTRTGRTYRLPTEAEWEYAARGGTATAYWWGDGYDATAVPRGKTDPVAAHDANPFGLYDMLGNAREWVADCYVNTHDGRPSDARAVTAGDCQRRVVRGGAWNSPARDLRSANRGRFGQTSRLDYLGVRLAADP